MPAFTGQASSCMISCKLFLKIFKQSTKEHFTFRSVGLKNASPNFLLHLTRRVSAAACLPAPIFL